MKKFFHRLYKMALIWFMGTKFYYTVVMKVIPYIRFTTYYTDFRGWNYKRGYKLMQPGDFLVVQDSKKLTNILVPGEWNHAVQVLTAAGDDEWEVSEMTHHNYTKSCFFDICSEATRVAIYRCKNYDQDYINNVVIPTCKAFASAVYAVDFAGAQLASAQVMTLGIPALYCSELVYQSDPERRLGADLTDLADLGRPYISPTGLTTAANVELIWDSNNEIPPIWHD